MENKEFDLVILGAGPGGYVAAIRAAQLGLKTCIVEREHLGGICLNWGCIPTKALLRAAELRHMTKNLEPFGISCGEINFDIDKIVKRSRSVSEQLTQGIKFLLKKHKVQILYGSGRLDGANRVEVVTEDSQKRKIIIANNIILATGARARPLGDIVADGDLIINYKDAMIPKTIPKKLLVIGSGAIGVEFASFYSGFGSTVTVVEMLDRILPVEDTEISALAEKAFRSQGIEIYTGSRVISAQKNQENKVVVEIEDADGKKEERTFDRVIVAVGIIGNTENLNLEQTSIEVTKGHIATDEWMETREKGIYAIGDVTGPPWLAHKSSHQGIICVEKIAGVDGISPLNVDNIPGCTYCLPQIASVGLTESEAINRGYKIRVGRFPYGGNGKALALGETEGLIKTIFEHKTGELLGAHMIGSEVTELIQGYTIAKTLECTEADLIHTVFPHPTLSEMMHESVLDAYERAIHI